MRVPKYETFLGLFVACTAGVILFVISVLFYLGKLEAQKRWFLSLFYP